MCCKKIYCICLILISLNFNNLNQMLKLGSCSSDISHLRQINKNVCFYLDILTSIIFFRDLYKWVTMYTPQQKQIETKSFSIQNIESITNKMFLMYFHSIFLLIDSQQQLFHFNVSDWDIIIIIMYISNP